MTIGVIYLLILLPAVALIAGGLAVVGTRREADRIRAAEAARRQAGGD